MSDFSVKKRVIQLNSERGYSMYKLAMLAKMPPSTLTNMELRGTELSIKSIEKICRVYGMSLAEFFTDEGLENIVPVEIRRALGGPCREQLIEIAGILNSLTDEKE